MIKKHKTGRTLLALALLTSLIVPATTTLKANAEDITGYSVEESIEARGIFTNLSLYLDGDNGTISAIVKNQFTLLPAQVRVYVELYCSDTYQDSYEKMELVLRNYTADLNMGDTISVTASTNGETKYWLGRINSRMDNNDWQTKTTGCFLFDGNGNLVE